MKAHKPGQTRPDQTNSTPASMPDRTPIARLLACQTGTTRCVGIDAETSAVTVTGGISACPSCCLESLHAVWVLCCAVEVGLAQPTALSSAPPDFGLRDLDGASPIIVQAPGDDGLSINSSRRTVGLLDLFVRVKLDALDKHLFFLCLDLLDRSLGAERRVEALAHRLNHLAEPVEVERVERQVGGQVCSRKPKRHCLLVRCEAHYLARRGVGRSARLRQGAVDVIEDADGGVGTPAEAGGEKCPDEEEAVVELEFGPGQVELVAKPVDVEKRTRELVKDKGRCVVVDKWTLLTVSNWPTSITSVEQQIRTKPKLKTASALTACASNPSPNSLT